MADVKFLVSIDTKSGTASLKEFEGALDGTAKAGEKAGSSIKNTAIGVMLGEAAFNIGRKALQGFKDLLGSSVKEAMAQEDADRALAASLELTGRTVEGNIEHYKKWAAEKQKVTRYTSGEIEQAQALMIQLTDLDQKGMDKAMKGAMGLATVMGGDLQGAARMVSQVMEGNYTMLGKYIPAVRNAKTETEKKAAALDGLAKMYGRAEADSQTFSGRLDQIRKTADQTKEAIGGIIIRGLEPFITMIGKAADGILALMQRADEADQRFGKNARSWAEQGNVLREIALKAGMSEAAYRTLAFACREYDDRTNDIIRSNKGVVGSWEAEQRALDLNSGSVATNIGKMLQLLGTTEQGRIIVAAYTAAMKAKAGAVKEAGEGSGKAAGEVKLLDTAISLSRSSWANVGESLKATAGLLAYLSNELPENRAKWKSWADVLAYATGEGESLDKVMERLGGNSIKTYSDKVRAALRDQQTLTTAFKAGKISAEDYGKAMKKTQDAIRGVGDENKEVTETVKVDWAAAGRAVVDIMRAALSGSSFLTQAYYDNEMAKLAFFYEGQTNALDSWYQAKKAALEAEGLDAETLAENMKALDAEYAQKKKDISVEQYTQERMLKKKAFEEQKRISITQAVMDTASAVVSAMSVKPFIPAGLIAMALAGALGAVQISAISKQSFPLAGGAVFHRATEFTMPSGRTYEAGESGVEFMNTEAMLRKVVREEAGGRQRPQRLVHNTYIGTRLIKSEIINITNEGFQTGQLRTYLRNSN